MLALLGAKERMIRFLSPRSYSMKLIQRESLDGE